MSGDSKPLLYEQLYNPYFYFLYFSSSCPEFNFLRYSYATKAATIIISVAEIIISLWFEIATMAYPHVNEKCCSEQNCDFFMI